MSSWSCGRTAECHGAGKVQGEVDLTSIAKIMDSKDANLLKPGKPEKSDLYTSITERETPKERPKPSDKELALIRDWIAAAQGVIAAAPRAPSPTPAAPS